MQEALWWVHQRAKNKSVYNITWRMACSHAPDLAALQVAWQAVVERHDALRTALVLGADGLELVTLPELTVDLQRIEVDAEPSEELFRLIAEEIQEQPMQLDQAPLGQLVVVRIGEQHELLLIVHHVASDGWGNQLLLSDLSHAYAAARQGLKPAFEEQAPSFLEYAAKTPDWRKSLEYWTKTLDGAVSATVVADRHTTGDAGATVRYALSDEAVAGLVELSRMTMATPFVATLAALQIVLARGGAGPDVAVGINVANRVTQQEQDLVGYTSNLCVTVATVTEQDTVLDVVTRARNTTWSVLAHQAVPYPVVFGALPEATQRTLEATSPVLLDYLGTIGSGLSLDDIDLTLYKAPNRVARSDIAVVIWEAGKGFMADLEYNVGRYDLSSVLGLIQDVDTVLSAGARTSVTDLDLRTRSTAGHIQHRAAPVAPEQLPETPSHRSRRTRTSSPWAAGRSRSSNWHRPSWPKPGSTWIWSDGWRNRPRPASSSRSSAPSRARPARWSCCRRAMARTCICYPAPEAARRTIGPCSRRCPRTGGSPHRRNADSMPPSRRWPRRIAPISTVRPTSCAGGRWAA
jgi:hypothetical protein